MVASSSSSSSSSSIRDEDEEEDDDEDEWKLGRSHALDETNGTTRFQSLPFRSGL
jgi:hypothetical protein